mgnify:FL=1
MARLRTEHAKLAYSDEAIICDDVTVEIPDRMFTVIVGPNGCGLSLIHI